MKLKRALSFQDQVVLLRSRGMIIEAESEAEQFLTVNNYFRLNYYFHKLMDYHDHFFEGTRFQQIMDIYKNDSWLRNQLLLVLEEIEIKVRTQIAYHLGRTYGSEAFYKMDIYKNTIRHQVLMCNFIKEINRDRSDPVRKHHVVNYGGCFPIWVVVEYFSFSTLSKYFDNLEEADKRVIAKDGFGLNENYLGSWLHALSYLRNVCAHYGHLFRRQHTVRPRLMKSWGWDKSKNHSLYAMFLIMGQLIETVYWNEIIQKIEEKEKVSQYFCLSDYGFPSDWTDYLI